MDLFILHTDTDVEHMLLISIYLSVIKKKISQNSAAIFPDIAHLRDYRSTDVSEYLTHVSLSVRFLSASLDLNLEHFHKL